MKDTADIMFSLIRYELTGETPVLPAPGMLEEIYTLSKKHDLAHLAGDALKKLSVPMTEELSQKFDRQIMTALFRYEQSRYELERIKAVFEEEKIPFVPLKGSVIRDIYPEPWMRTSCDIDILVKEDDLDSATDALKSKLEYTVEGRGSHDIQLKSSGNVNIELHYTLIEENFVSKNVESVLNDAWAYAIPENGGFRYSFTDEFFLFYHIAHMAKHFTVGGGCGIRPFLDLYLIGKEKELETELVTSGGIFEFFEASKKLSNVWFSKAAHTETTVKMQNYILSGGVFGTLKNRVAVGKEKTGGGFSYVLSRIFPPYGVMKNQHPSLKKLPFLLPLFYALRLIRPIFDGRLKKTAKELNLSAKSSADAELAELMKELKI